MCCTPFLFHQNSLLFLFIKFNSGNSGSEISKDARRVITSVHQFDCPRLCSCTRVSKAFLGGSSAWRFSNLSLYLITFRFLLSCSGKRPVSLNTASVGVCNLSGKFLAYGFVEPCTKVVTHILGLPGSVNQRP